MSSFLNEVIVYICEAVISCVFLLNLLKSKHNVCLTLLLWCELVATIMLVTPAFTLQRILVTTAVEFVFLFLAYEDTLKSKLGKYFLKQSLAALSSIISYGIYRGMLDRNVSILRGCSDDDCTYCLLYLLTFSVVTSIVCQFAKKRRGVEIPWVVGTQFVVGVGECIAVLAAATNLSDIIYASNSRLIVVAVIFMIVANISIGSFASYLLNQVFISRNMDFGKEISNMEYKYYEMSVENDKKIRAIKHDISNQIQTVYSLFKRGEEKKGFEIIDQLKERYSSVEQIVYCENPVVNIILSNKKREAEDNGIETHIRVKQSLEAVPVTDYDLSTVICNLVDNALEGCINSEQTNPKLIVELLCKNNYLVIRVLNSCRVSMNIEGTDKIETTKAKSQNHGIGMSIIAGVAKKYKGDFLVSAQNGIFTSTVVLSIK